MRPELGPTVEALTRVARILERASPELSLSHYRVLSMIWAGNGRASRLAERLALGKPAISAAVESLVARGLIARSSLDPDRRVVHLEITPKGFSALATAELAMSRELAHLLEHAPNQVGTRAALKNLSLAVAARQAAHQVDARAPDHLPESIS